MTWTYEIPLIERIALDIIETVSAVQVGNGYHVNISDVIRPGKQVTAEYRHMNLIMLQTDDPEREGENTSDDGEATSGEVIWMQTFDLNLVINPDPQDPTPLDELINVARADLEKALMQDHTRGGLAIDTTILPPVRLIDEDGEFALVRVRPQVKFRHAISDPYLQT